MQRQSKILYADLPSSGGRAYKLRVDSKTSRTHDPNATSYEVRLYFFSPENVLSEYISPATITQNPNGFMPAWCLTGGNSLCTTALEASPYHAHLLAIREGDLTNTL
ncbi:hypothetical protein MVEN_00645600 [Mycena venus]|uniref:Uncharacterized protein n=1 Tax=Mycena venus TaxID=2733690 RepID=A0A8H6YS54_9AGAR|nr:hypothetical protein MVEN_00645600 [Mycena venus]